MNESFAEFLALAILMLVILCVILYGPMLIVGGLMMLAS